MGTPDSITILNTPVHLVTGDEVLHIVKSFMQEPHLHQIATSNPEFVMTAQHDDEFRLVLNQSDLCIADGIGLIYASKYLGTPLPERVPGSELVFRLAEMAAQKNWRLFLLGAAPGVAEKAAVVFKNSYPGIKIAGTYAGSPNPSENDGIVARINDAQADILFVAYGAPKQDTWIARNRASLTTVRLAMGVGGSLDFVTGKAVRAPRWVQNLNLEWLYRLGQEPWRWRRMLALPKFAIKVLLTPRS